MTCSAGSLMTLSDDLKCLCLGESLNTYATSRFILENELYSSQGKAQSVENAEGKFEETSKPLFRSLTDHPGEFSQLTSYLGCKVNHNLLKRRAVYPIDLVEGVSSNTFGSGVSGVVSTQNMAPLVN